MKTTIVVNNVIQYTKDHWKPIAVIAGLIVIYKFAFWELPKQHQEETLRLHPEKIYLSLWETGREVALNRDNIEVPPIIPIKTGEEFVFRIILRQENNAGTSIPNIHITFPDTAEVRSDVSPIGTWLRNNDPTNTYFISYPSTAKFYKSNAYNLPAFYVKVKDVKIPISYKITVDGLSEPIIRHFIIDASLDYNSYFKQHFSMNTAENIPELEHMASGNGEGFLRIISYDDISKSNSATATCVEVSPATASFVYPLNPYKQDSHTVSEDAETIKR